MFNRGLLSDGMAQWMLMHAQTSRIGYVCDGQRTTKKV
jgi:hypothetical protein